MAKAIFKIPSGAGKIHSVRQFVGKYNHNLRKTAVKNADPERVHLNKELISLEGKTMTQAYRDRMSDLDYYKNHKPRKDAVLGVEAILGIGTKDFPPGFDVDAWAKGNVEWLKERFGEENVISAVLHMDETTPHIHAVIIPVNEQTGRLSTREVIGGPAGLRDIQREYGERMKAYGLEPPTPYSVADQKTLDDLYNSVNQAVSYKLPEPEPEEDIEDYMIRAQAEYQKMNLKNVMERKKLEDKIQEMNTQILGENKEKAAMMAELQAYQELFGENIEEIKKRMKLLERIEEGLKNHPNKELTESAREVIGKLVDYAKEQEYEEFIEKNAPDIED